MLKKYHGVMLGIILGLLFSVVSVNAAKSKTKWVTQAQPVKIPILMYHSIETRPGNSLCVPENEFAEQMKYLHEQGYVTLTPAEVYHAFSKNKLPQDKKVVMLTFDDGYANNYTAAYPILKKYHLKATIGIITSKIDTPDMLTSAQLKKLKKSKLISLVSHTVNHFELNQLSAKAQLEELTASKQWLDENFHQKTRLVIYPVGRYSEQTPELAKQAGYDLGLTTHPGLATKDQGMYQLHRQRVVPGMSELGFSELVKTAS
ncbi:polysaccharide deacetylase family protein [Ligilactobacillus apodemi]|uniref:polysaccharide deacetylase family protein n=1 Tax=Ligilactobacillus apodemi TaxID=307126 RepID=UPI00214B5FCA|nr:polysaccharide deacetylase family protein [Ligilactobacillus apodemi]MCR1901219.1 polysaccharide deacetylase family protein [Ligilactobacillus apodemi]